MKKLLTLATAALIFSASFAHEGKDCGKEKCTKAEMAKCKKAGKKDCCKKDDKAATVKASKAKTTPVATKKA